MKANAVPLLAIFEKKMRLEVPLFQRQYVWNQEQQWEPLWEDISRKFTEYLEGRKDAPVHFLGAMVLDQKQTPTTHVEKRQVIDGQQRLITLQIFLAALRDFCRDQKCMDLAQELESFTLNRGMMADPAVDKYKVWPTKLDRDYFSEVMSACSLDGLLRKHPRKYRKYSRRPEPRPRIIEGYLFFNDKLREFFIGTQNDSPLFEDILLSERLETCFQSLRDAIQVVVIDLDQNDDAQIIFETLNARGEPLLPADLLRNYIFLRAARKGESQEALYNEYWARFDDPFWRTEVKQGRLLRPRSDLFMQHFLASRLMVDIPIKHLFAEYKFWIEKRHPFPSVRDELVSLSSQGDDFRRIINPKKNDVLYSLSKFLDDFDIRTSYPLLLSMLDARLDDEAWEAISRTLESYLLRRAICGLTTKNYNRIFLSLTRNLQSDGMTHENLERQLASQMGDSGEWPRDEAFAAAWLSSHCYINLNNSKIVHIFRRLNNTYLNSKMETIPIEGSLTVEHILPNQWIENWLLPDGSKGLTTMELWTLSQDEKTKNDPRIEMTRKRTALLQTLGNLTILTQPLNSSISNSPWEVKKEELLRSSLLPINQQLWHYDKWDEEAIKKRAKELFDRALTIWPPPTTY